MTPSAQFVIEMPWDEDAREELVSEDCSRCGSELVDGSTVFMWPEPLGDSGMAVAHVHCSQTCADEAITAWRQGSDRPT